MPIRPIVLFLSGVVLLHAWIASAASAAQATPPRSLLALSKNNHTLAIVDPVTLKVLARVPVGPDPHEVIASSDGLTAYVSNTGSGRMHELDLIDLVAKQALPSFDTGALLGPHGLVFVGGKLWFTAEGAKSVARYDPATAKVDWILGTGQNRTHMLDVSADATQVTTTNVDSSTVSILEDILLQPMPSPMGAPPPGAKPRLEWLETIVPVGKGSEGFDVSPDGRELWTAAAQDGTLSIVDLAGKKLAASIDAKVFGANRLKFTPERWPQARRGGSAWLSRHALQ
jgi:DNA-binding beta-propeller fold protein YncE